MKTRYKVLIILAAVVGLLGAAAMVTLVILSMDEPPPDDSDLQVHRLDVAEDENGYTYLREAGKVLWWPGYDSGAAYADAGFPEEPERQKDPVEMEKAERLEKIAAGKDWDDVLVDEVLAHNAETFALIEKALACPHFQVPPVLSIFTRVPEIFDWLSLMNLQAVRARAFFKRGREKQAFDEALKIVRTGHTIQGAKGCLIHYSVGQTVKLRGLEVMRQMLPATVLDAKQLKACAKSLVSHDANEDGLTDAFRVEYQIAKQAIDDVATGKQSLALRGLPGLFETPNRLVFQPNRTKRLLAEDHRATIESLGSPYAAMAFPEMPEPQTWRLWLPGNSVGEYLRVLSASPMMAYTILVLKCQENVEVAATRVLLAMKAFKGEKGRLPKTWWKEENPGFEEDVEPEIWQLPDPSFPIEF